MTGYGLTHRTPMRASRSGERRDLGKRQQAILDARPSFDPAALNDAWRNWDTARRNGTPATVEARRHVTLLERQSSQFDDWSRAATKATDILRHLDAHGQRTQRTIAIRRR